MTIRMRFSRYRDDNSASITESRQRSELYSLSRSSHLPTRAVRAYTPDLCLLIGGESMSTCRIEYTAGALINLVIQTRKWLSISNFGNIDILGYWLALRIVSGRARDIRDVRRRDQQISVGVRIRPSRSGVRPGLTIWLLHKIGSPSNRP